MIHWLSLAVHLHVHLCGGARQCEEDPGVCGCSQKSLPRIRGEYVCAWSHAGRLSSALMQCPPGSCTVSVLQPLEAVSPVLLNPHLDPKKPVAIELLNKVWKPSSLLRAIIAILSPAQIADSAGAAVVTYYGGVWRAVERCADGGLLWRGPRRVGGPGWPGHQQAAAREVGFA